MQKPCEHIRRLPDAAPVTQLEIGKELLTLACKFNTVDLNPEDGVVELGVCLAHVSSLYVSVIAWHISTGAQNLVCVPMTAMATHGQPWGPVDTRGCPWEPHDYHGYMCGLSIGAHVIGQP
jgi:hypothetical protein